MANVPISNITATWDDAAQTFYGFRLTVTDTLYNSSSKIFDLLTTGGSKFSVDVDGNVSIAGNITTAGQDVHLSNNTTNSVYIHSGSQASGANLYLAGAGTLTTVSLSVGYTGARLRSPNSLSWTSGTAINTSSDTGLSRYSAGVVKITDGSTGFGSLYAAGIGVGTTTPGELVDVVGNVQAVEFIGSLRGAVLFKAKAGEALTKGDVVYISGISGNTTVVSKADANDASKMPAFGLVKETASSQGACEVYTFGTFQGLDTSSYTEGTELFVSTTAGVLTDTPPSGESSLIQKVAKVTRSHASAGSLKVIGAGRTNATPNLNNGNIFIGNASNQASTASLSSYLAPYAPIASPTFTGTVTVSGDLNVAGTTTTINTTNLDVQDAVITLNKGQVTPANDIGLLFQRYSTPTASNYNIGIAWDESASKLVFGKTPETGSDNELTFNTELLTISESGALTAGSTRINGVLGVNLDSPSYQYFGQAQGTYNTNIGGYVKIGKFSTAGKTGLSIVMGQDQSQNDYIYPFEVLSANGSTRIAGVRADGVLTGSIISTANTTTAAISQVANINYRLGLNLNNASVVAWSSDTTWYGAKDLELYRDDTGTLAQRNGTNAQEFRIYNTYTDASNYERGFMKWNANTLEIGTEAGGTGAARNITLNPAGGVVRLPTGSGEFTVRAFGSGTRLVADNGLYLNGYNGGLYLQSANGPISRTAIRVQPGSLTTSSIDDYGMSLVQTLNDTTANTGAAYSAFKINVTETDVTGWDSVKLIDAQVGGTSKFSVANTGDTVVDGALTFASDGAGGNWLKFYRQQANYWRLTTSGIGDVFIVAGNSVTFPQNVTIQRGGLLVQPTLTSTAEPFKGIITFNDVTKTYSAFKLDVTDTASAAGSSLIDLHLGGVSKFRIDTAGGVTSGSLLPKAHDTYTLGDASNKWSEAWATAGNFGSGAYVKLFNGGYPSVKSSSGGLYIGSNFTHAAYMQPTAGEYLYNMDDISILSWADTGNGAHQPGTTKIWSPGTNIVGFGKNASQAHTLRIYNTYTDVSNYEFGSVGWDTNEFVIGTEAAGTGTQREIKLGYTTTIDGGNRTNNYALTVENCGAGNGGMQISRIGGATLNIGQGLDHQQVAFVDTANRALKYRQRGSGGIGAGTYPAHQFVNDALSGTAYPAVMGVKGLSSSDLFHAQDASDNVVFSVGYTGNVTASSILLSANASLTSETTTLATVSATQVASFPTTHLGAKLVIQAADTVSGERQISELTIIHDGTTVSVAEYGIVHTGSAALASYTAAIVSTNVIVSATGASANSTTYKVVETLI